MNVYDIVLRLLLVSVFSGLIGYEREVNQSHAGLKTHLIVGLSAAIIALIQQNIVIEVINLELLYPSIAGVVKADPARLIGQVVSGIGFLGGGTIIVTKRNVSGLTTAASIWSVSAVGLALGMGYYEISVFGFIFIYLSLYITKKIQSLHYNKKINIEYVGGKLTVDEINDIFTKMGLHLTHLSYSIRMFGDERVYSSMFEVTGSHFVEFHEITDAMLQSKTIISVRENNLE